MESLPHASVGGLFGGSEGGVKDTIVTGNSLGPHIGGEAIEFCVVLLLDFLDQVGAAADRGEAEAERLSDKKFQGGEFSCKIDFMVRVHTFHFHSWRKFQQSKSLFRLILRGARAGAHQEIVL